VNIAELFKILRMSILIFKF